MIEMREKERKEGMYTTDLFTKELFFNQGRREDSKERRKGREKGK